MKSIPKYEWIVRTVLYLSVGVLTVVCLGCSEEDKFMAPQPIFPEIDRFPVWSPDGERVIYFHFGVTEIREGGSFHIDYDQFGIWMVDITGANPHLIIQGATYAEYVTVPASQVAHKRASMSHVEAAGLSLVGLTVWQALFDAAGLSPGQTVLVHAAAGGVGHIAVQLAKWKGARVIGTASARNEAYLRSLG